MPEGAIYVGRPSRWGNPYPVGVTSDPVLVAATERYGRVGIIWPIGPRSGQRHGRLRPHPIVITAAEATFYFRRDAQVAAADDPTWLAELRGHDLVCWCPLHQPCHADVLLELANA